MNNSSWTANHRASINIVAVAVACLALGFTIGTMVGRSYGDRAAARSQSSLERAETMVKQAIALAETCNASLQHALHAPPAAKSAEPKRTGD